MKPKQRLLIAAWLVSLCGASLAQSSVTLFGVLDANVGRFKGAPTGVGPSDAALWRQDSGGLTTSFFGLRGSEDLGDGLAASFELSSFMRNDSGAVGRSDAIGPPVNVAADPFWARSSWVGLSSRTAGRLRLGNFGSPMWIGSLSSNAFGDSTTFSPLNLVTFIGGPLTGGTGWTNQIAYDSPPFAGFTLAAAISASEGQGGRNSGLRLGYGNGPFAASLATQNVKKNPLTFADGTSPNNTVAWQLATSYDFGTIKLWAHVGRIQNHGTESAPLNIGYRVWDLSAAVPIGSGNLLAGYASRKTGDAVGPVPATVAGGNVERQVFTVGYDYFVSKRTDVYVMVMNDRTLTNVLPVPPHLASAGATDFGVGLRLRF